MHHSTGILAAAAGSQLPPQVLKSGRGYYIGTMNSEGPVSRESEEYFRTHDKASKALLSGSWTQRQWA